jgi:3-oxoacyl-[acyl-carrier protein] reductase
METKGMRLAGKAALVTGAARGIGRVIAELFAREGAVVVIADIREPEGIKTAQAIREAGGNAHFVKADLRRENDIRNMVDFAAEKLRRLDVIVNNARPKLRPLPFSESLEEWDLAMDVLLKAPALVARYALPHLIRSGGGSIVNISSTNAFFISHQPAAYHVAKAGLQQLTRYLACNFGPDGVRANAICPGLVDLEEKPLTGDPLNRAVTGLAVPMRRASTATEIAEAALFLSTSSSAYLTGQVMTLDGGLTLKDHFHVARQALLWGREDRERKESEIHPATQKGP